MGRIRALAALSALALLTSTAVASAAGTGGPAHGIAMHGSPKYPADFKNFEYVNPNAPKGGTQVTSAIGTFDSLNGFIIQGNPAAGMGLTYDSLMESAADEPFTQYCLICKTIEVPEDRSWVEFTLREEARWHDGKPISVDDVIFSANVLREQGAPFFRFYYGDIATVEQTGPRKVKFTFGGRPNPELPLIIGQLTILPKHYWQDREFAKTTLDIPLGSGPYKVSDVKPGRSITFERVENYWAKDLPVKVGRHNYQVQRFEYFRDQTVAREAFKAGDMDLWVENTAKEWATAFTNVPAVKDGKIRVEEFAHKRTAGMQGFVFNLRKPMFQNPRVREALTLAFDFEWSNANLFYNAYTRTDSFFDNSVLGSRGLLKDADAEEREILEKYRSQLPEQIFTAAFKPPATDGSGTRGIRTNLRNAANMLKETGWQVKDKKLVNTETGEPFQFEILLVSPAFERIALPYKRNLERLGIDASVRTVDPSQYQNRLDSFDYDMIVGSWGQSQSPGNEQRNYWSSEAAKRPGARNLSGIQNPVIDELVELVITAPDRDSLVQRTRALDRALLWGFYIVPHWHIPHDRVAFWDRYGRPDVIPAQGVVLDAWWVDTTKDSNLGRRANSSSGG
jgi:microcin C transport system substrate-binding protein